MSYNLLKNLGLVEDMSDIKEAYKYKKKQLSEQTQQAIADLIRQAQMSQQLASKQTQRHLAKAGVRGSAKEALATKAGITAMQPYTQNISALEQQKIGQELALTEQERQEKMQRELANQMFWQNLFSGLGGMASSIYNLFK